MLMLIVRHIFIHIFSECTNFCFNCIKKHLILNEKTLDNRFNGRIRNFSAPMLELAEVKNLKCHFAVAYTHAAAD